MKSPDRSSRKPWSSLAVTVDSHVLESDVHFPTDLNLLWDAGRKCGDLTRVGSYEVQGEGTAKPAR